jgi:Fic family protein
VPALTERLVRWLDQLRSGVTSKSRREDRFVVALLSAVLAHLYIAWVHPFGVTPEGLTTLTTPLAKRYAAVGPRIPARDLNDLVKMGLVAKTGKRTYRARREIIEAFIPPTADA